jgi:hypothetical protein
MSANGETFNLKMERTGSSLETFLHISGETENKHQIKIEKESIMICLQEGILSFLEAKSLSCRN